MCIRDSLYSPLVHLAAILQVPLPANPVILPTATITPLIILKIVDPPALSHIVLEHAFVAGPIFIGVNPLASLEIVLPSPLVDIPVVILHPSTSAPQLPPETPLNPQIPKPRSRRRISQKRRSS